MYTKNNYRYETTSRLLLRILNWEFQTLTIANKFKNLFFGFLLSTYRNQGRNVYTLLLLYEYTILVSAIFVIISDIVVDNNRVCNTLYTYRENFENIEKVSIELYKQVRYFRPRKELCLQKGCLDKSSNTFLQFDFRIFIKIRIRLVKVNNKINDLERPTKANSYSRYMPVLLEFNIKRNYSFLRDRRR